MSTTSSQSISSVQAVISANIEVSVLSDLCKEPNCHCHCLCLQETHRGARKARPGMTLVAERHHDEYGSGIFIRDDLKVKKIYVTVVYYVKVITAGLQERRKHFDIGGANS